MYNRRTFTKHSSDWAKMPFGADVMFLYMTFVWYTHRFYSTDVLL